MDDTYQEDGVDKYTFFQEYDEEKTEIEQEVEKNTPPLSTQYMLWFNIGFFIVFEVLSVVTFVKINKQNSPDKPHVQKWLENYKKGCGKSLDMTYALQNASLNGCGYLTVWTVSYISYLYRYQTCDAFKSVPIAEGNIKKKDNCSKCKIAFFRLFLTALSVAFTALPAIFIKVKMVKSPIVVLFTNIIVPLAVAFFLIMGGPVDYFIYHMEQKLDSGSAGDEEQ